MAEKKLTEDFLEDDLQVDLPCETSGETKARAACCSKMKPQETSIWSMSPYIVANITTNLIDEKAITLALPEI